MTYTIKYTCYECKETCSIEHRIGDWDFSKLSDKCPNCKKDSLCAYQPEVTMRGKPEEFSPPEDPFKCAKCCKSFDPSDWNNDFCDDCLYGRSRS